MTYYTEAKLREMIEKFLREELEIISRIRNYELKGDELAKLMNDKRMDEIIQSDRPPAIKFADAKDLVFEWKDSVGI